MEQFSHRRRSFFCYADPGRPVGEYEYSRLGHHLYELSCLALFTAFNNPQDGIDINIHNFNGLQELMKRADAPVELLSVYKQMDAARMAPKSNAINQTSWSLKRSYFELLLAQDAIINKMSETDRMDLLGEARKKLYQKWKIL